MFVYDQLSLCMYVCVFLYVCAYNNIIHVKEWIGLHDAIKTFQFTVQLKHCYKLTAT